MEDAPTARIYVDGFNLYRRCLESRPHLKWLDLFALGTLLLPQYRVIHVDYFTAHLRPGMLVDPQSPVRQQMYLRALRSHPNIEVHLGTFRNDRRNMPLHPLSIDPETRKWRTVAVRKLEEKGSDVNLGTRMTADAFTAQASTFVILSNDSDLAGPLRMLKHEFGFSTGIIFPMPSSRSSKELVKTLPDVIAHVTEEDLAASQFSRVRTDEVGTFSCPAKWR
jgi:uncharacterized LabA/DUF88 family protein